ncbi:PAS domain S-box protein [Aerosakkonema sp. BLCC-F183]|uniref:PAS domain S-box protein n=1 Tax=Aerosakkonema sp. BLCC-F183 TaxID=3342834 RepID=UPI0035B81AD1
MTSQEELDNITRLAAHICQSAIALIYLTDGTQQWFASEGSLEGLQISTDSAYYAYAVLHKDLLIIEDTWQDTKLSTTPLATFSHSVRFYVGIPLINCKGDSLGCLCVMDVKPRQFTNLQKEGLQILANHVTNQLESHHRTSQVLRESETSFQLLVQSVKDYAIFMLDRNGYVITWNEGAEKIKGYKPEEIIGQHFSRFYPQEDILRGKPNRVLKMAATEGGFEDEAWRVRKDGSRFWANVVITALRDESGKLKGFAKVTRDITERKRAEEQLIHNAFHDALTGLPNRA